MWIGAALALAATALVVVLSLGKKGRHDMAADGVLGEPATGAGRVRGDEPAAAGVGSTSGNGRGGTREPEERVLVSAGQPTGDV